MQVMVSLQMLAYDNVDDKSTNFIVLLIRIPFHLSTVFLKHGNVQWSRFHAAFSHNIKYKSGEVDE